MAKKQAKNKISQPKTSAEQFVEEYNQLVAKYGYTLVPVIKLELRKLNPSPSLRP